MDDSFGAGGFNANTTQSGSGEDKPKEGILPVCVRQLLLADTDVKMYNFAYQLVSLVVIVRKIDYTSTKITYTIEDHTGRMEAFYWVEDETAKQPSLTQNAYANMIGSLRKVGDQNVLIIYHAEEVTSMNQVTSHLLEILFVRFKAEQFSKGGGAFTRGAVSCFGGMNSNVGNGGSNGTQPMDTFGGSVPSHGMTGKNALIYQAISTNNESNNGAGISREQLYQKFPKIPHVEVDDLIEFLIQEGHTYSTISSDNFKTVE